MCTNYKQLVFVLHNKMDEVLKYGITVYAEKRVGVSKERGILGEKFPPIQSSTPLGLCFDQNRQKGKLGSTTSDGQKTIKCEDVHASSEKCLHLHDRH